MLPINFGCLPAPPVPFDDVARVASLQRFEILDTPPEAAFDELAEVAARVCETPTGLVTLIDAKRQWFKARFGFSPTETDRALAFCGYTIANCGLLEVEDAETDPRFADNPLVTSEPRIRFYAGAPIVASDGYAIGSLAVIDYKPRKLADGQRATLLALANQVAAQLELRRLIVERERQNLTSRRETELKLRQSVERFELASRATQDVIWDWDLRTNVLWWSDALALNFGHDLTKLGPGISSWLELVHPDDRAVVEESIQRVFEQRGAYWSGEYRFRRGDETYAHVFDRGYVKYDSDGGPLRMIGALADMTERRRLEDQLVRSQKMEAIGQLSSGLAHDLNNLLTVIQCNAFVLGGKVTEDLAICAKDILYATDRAAALTRQLLLLGRKQHLRESSVDINHFVTDMTRILERTLTARITLTASLDPSVPPIRADASMLEQVLLNLVINARDAMENGGTLTIATSQVTVAEPVVRHKLTAEPGVYVCLTVQDTGSGIDPATMPQIFEPFFTTKEIGRGTGLGLSTVYYITKQHHGWLDVSSSVGSGSTFTIAFPAALDAQPREESPFTQGELPTGTETLLVVEDEPLLRDRIARLLRQYGYQVLESASGADAFDVWKTHGKRIDLVLTDLVMPGEIDGRQLAHQLRSERPDLCVIYASGFAPEQTGEGEALVDGVNFLEKPYAPSKLLQLIRLQLDRRGSR